MALINCPECGKEISDKAISCPNCGMPINQPCPNCGMIINQPTPQPQEDEYLCCPKCNSRELHAGHKGFSGGKVFTGALITDGIGLLAGTIGSRDTQITCLKCGNKFKAGEAKVVKISIEDETQIIVMIKSQGTWAAVKWYNEATNCGIKEAKDIVESIREKYEKYHR